MAKTAEEKAQREADREAARAAKDQERAEARAEKQQERADRQSERDQLANLTSAQKAEILAYKEALSDSGLSNKEIKNLLREEKKANKEEKVEARDFLSEDGLQYIGVTGIRPDGTEFKGPIVSKMDTIAEEYQQPIVEDIKGALSYYSDYNLPILSVRDNARLGFGLDRILEAEYSRDPETGEFTLNNQFTKTLDAAQDYVKQTFTADDLAEQGVKLKQDKNNPDLYTYKFGSDEKKGYVFFKDNHDGTFTGVGANRLSIDVPGGALGEVFREVPFLPEIAAIAASFIPGAQPFVGEIYAAGKGLQTNAYGGDIGDVLKSAGLAYLSTNVLPGYVNQVLPADIAKIPGVVPGISKVATGVLSGQDVDQALLSGLATGVGTFGGAQLGEATGSPQIGKYGGALLSAGLSGQDLDSILKNMAIAAGMGYAKENVLPAEANVGTYITDPTAAKIAESSLSKIINQAISGQSGRSIPTPIPGVVSRQFVPNMPTRLAARGGHMRAPIRRDVSELIPIRRGALSMMRT